MLRCESHHESLCTDVKRSARIPCTSLLRCNVSHFFARSRSMRPASVKSALSHVLVEVSLPSRFHGSHRNTTGQSRNIICDYGLRKKPRGTFLHVSKGKDEHVDEEQLEIARQPLKTLQSYEYGRGEYAVGVVRGSRTCSRTFSRCFSG